MANPVDLKDFVAGFLLEAEEHLHSINRHLVETSEALKKRLPEPRAIRELFRSIHTIKGLASMVGAEPIVDISHEMESILRLADRNGGKISDQALNLIIEGTRAIEERVNAISKNGVDAIPAAPKNLVEALALEASATSEIKQKNEAQFNLPPEVLKNFSLSDKEQISQAANANKRIIIAEFLPSAEKAALGITITHARDQLGKLGTLVKVIPQASGKSATGIAFLIILVTNEKNAALVNNTGLETSDLKEILVSQKSKIKEDDVYADELRPVDETAANDQSTIRVDIKRLDEALEKLSELVVTRFKLERVAGKLTEAGVDTRELCAVIADQSRQLKRLRTAITEARMVPLSEVLQRIPLVVRGLTKNSGKTINVVIQASSAEVDKAVADKIFPAIIHLVRNAVDHALETTSERKEKNKNEAGTLTIMCDDSSGTMLNLIIKDDGRGIDRELVAKKSGRPLAKNEEELLGQITLPGLSTKDNVTHTSGRGMGMDIVKKTIELLGGAFSLKTKTGEGTSFILKIPVSITIIDVFSFISNKQTFVAPIAMIDEIIEVNRDLVIDAPMLAKGGPRPLLIQHRGRSIPLFGLDALLNKTSGREVPAKALIIQRGEGALAFGVDKMLGQQEVVVRPLNDKLFRSSGMSGATDLGDGKPTLVLDLATLGAELTSQQGYQ